MSGTQEHRGTTDFAVEYAAVTVAETVEESDRDWRPGVVATVTHALPREFNFTVTEGAVSREELELIEHILTRPVDAEDEGGLA